MDWTRNLPRWQAQHLTNSVIQLCFTFISVTNHDRYAYRNRISVSIPQPYQLAHPFADVAVQIFLVQSCLRDAVNDLCNDGRYHGCRRRLAVKLERSLEPGVGRVSRIGQNNAFELNVLSVVDRRTLDRRTVELWREIWIRKDRLLLIQNVNQ